MSAYDCHLRKSSPRYQDWRAILGGDEVPIENPIPFSATFGDSQELIEVHRLDLKRFTRDQLRRLIEWCSKQFKKPPENVEAVIMRQGFPIRAEDVIVSFEHRFFT